MSWMLEATSSPLRWFSEDEFVLDGTSYRCHEKWGQEVALEPGQMTIVKTRALVERYVELVQWTKPRNIVEIGIFKGGSTAFLAQLARPDKLVAVDIRQGPVEALEKFIDEHELRGSVTAYYGTNQADVEQIDEIIDREFPGVPLDLVIDDASHRVAETRATFHCLFPRVRPGGTYFIEDWSWAHNRMGVQLVRGPALSVLVFELILGCAYVPDIIAGVTLQKGWALVRRGPGHIGAGSFDLSSYMDDLGREMVAKLNSGVDATQDDFQVSREHEADREG